MSSNRLALVVIGAGCIAAAGVGGYIAARQTSTPAPVAAAARQTAPATAADRPVQETEATVGDTKPVEPQTETITPQPTTAPEPASAPVEPKKAASAPRAATAVPRAPKSMQARQVAPAPTLDRPWPNSGAASQAQTPAPMPPPETSAVPPPPQEPMRAPEPPEKIYQELTVSADSVIGLQTQSALSSERARVEDRVEARVTRDVRVGGQVAIPAGSRALGSVTLVEHGGKFKERARLGIRFHTLVLADGTRLPISTDTLYREGEAPGNDSAKKIGGGAVGGAILGAILGGGKGAVIGATAGGAAGAGVVAAGERSAATLPAGSPVTVRLLSPVTVTVEK